MSMNYNLVKEDEVMGLAILGILLGLSVALNALLFGVCAQQIKEKERLERERKERSLCEDQRS